MLKFSDAIANSKMQTFERDVLLKYQIFNGLFLGLPFADPDQAGARLPIFSKMANDWLENGKTAPQIVADFLAILPIAPERHLGLLLKFLQFIERQVVLFDSLEDAAFADVQDMSGYGTLDYFLHQINSDKNKYAKQLTTLLHDYKTRLVLTAHPTQFYPSAILVIIENLIQAIRNNDVNEIRNLFLQMGLTRFGNQIKPTPVEEANSIIWFLENVFYVVLPHIQSKLSTFSTNLDIGFWPGGDRDGNPYVTAEVTLQVAQRLRDSVLRRYYADIQVLRRRLTFDLAHSELTRIALVIKQDRYGNADELISDLENVAQILHNNYQSLFVEDVNALILKVKLFRFYFAKMDIRQNSAIHAQVVSYIFAEANICSDYLKLSDSERSQLLLNAFTQDILSNIKLDNVLAHEIIATIKAVGKIQQHNGINSIERYIISNTDSVASVLEVLWLVNLLNQHNPQATIILEVVPLFETIDDLANSERIMTTLFETPLYLQNVKYWKMCQTIMLGFSDGTKDGGYLMANWSIFQAKKRLSKLAKKYGVNLVFFDGRGGPPSRGGGETYSFYRSLAREIDDHEIQLTIQGQTISANFGTPAAATFNLEHLLSAGLAGRLFSTDGDTLDAEQEQLIEQLAQYAYESYTGLRNDPLFVSYLEEITPLKYLSEANIGSRPAKRNSGSKLKLEDLRAIPFGGAWMQMKQNILGYYGVGSALSQMIRENHDNVNKFSKLYQSSLLFKGLMDNAMQSLAHTNFALTRHLQSDEKFGKFWQKIYAEAQLSQQLLLLISGHDRLVAENQIKGQSIKFREQIIQPLVIIQQYAMDKLRHLSSDDPQYAIFEKIVKKSLAASINASRNSI